MYSAVFARNDSDPGYVVGWRFKRKFEAGEFNDEMTYAEAKKKAEELSEKEPEKTFWPQKKLEISAH
ncbi:MAG: hypothetical protein HUJ29_11415 [Gammaproteobacteria bacterium]|nr:hypothetical protein [Gammaproteobacteria bacterium]